MGTPSTVKPGDEVSYRGARWRVIAVDEFGFAKVEEIQLPRVLDVEISRLELDPPEEEA